MTGSRMALAMGLILWLVPFSSMAGEVTIPLVPGWNLVNLPLQPDNPAVQAVLAGTTATVTSAWKWENGAWAVYLPGEQAPGAYAQEKNFGQLSTLDAGQGFWLNSASTGELVVSGQPPSAGTVQLADGWNLLGVKTAQATTVATLFASVKPQVVTASGPGRGQPGSCRCPEQRMTARPTPKARGLAIWSTLRQPRASG